MKQIKTTKTDKFKPQISSKRKFSKNFFRKEERPNFYSMLYKQCEITDESMSMFLKFMDSKDLSLAEEIEQCEKKADKVRRKVIDYVENSFITPLDRHDLFAVSRSIDDITDKIKDLKDFLIFFNYTPTEKNLEMTELIYDSIHAVTEAVSHWTDDSPEFFWEHLVKAKKNENQIKRLYWENIDELEFRKQSLRNIIVVREFSKDLNSLANKTGKAADRISDIKIKSIK